MNPLSPNGIIGKKFTSAQEEIPLKIEKPEKRPIWKIPLGGKKKAAAIAEQQAATEKIRKLEQTIIEERAERARQERERFERDRLKIQQEEQKKWEEELKARQLKDRERQKREEKLKKLRLITPETLRELRELIRTRYELDVEIWSLRNVRKPDRGIVEQKMAKADATLQEIHQIVEFWEGTENRWTEAEWEQAQEVRRRVLAEGKRWWVDNPPWGED